MNWHNHLLWSLRWLRLWGAWPYADLSLLKVKESLIVIQMVQARKSVHADLHTICKHSAYAYTKIVLTILSTEITLRKLTVNKLNLSVT